MALRVLLLLVLLGAVLAPAHAGLPRVEVPPPGASADLDGRFAVRLEAPAGWTLQDALAAPGAPVPAGRSNFGLSDRPAWFLAEVANPAAQPRVLLLQVPFAGLDAVDLHIVRAGGSVELHRAGMSLPRAQRSIAAPGILLPVRLAAGESATLALRVQPAGVLNVPLRLHDEAAWAGRGIAAGLWGGLVYGLMLGLAAYNAFLFAFTRDRAFLWYVLTGVAALAYFVGYDDLLAAGQADGRWLQQRGLWVAAMLSVGCTLQFARHFLQLRPLHAGLDRIMRACALAALALAVPVALPAVPLALALLLVIGGSIGMTLLLLAGAWRAWRTGRPLAPSFIAAMLVHLAVLGFTTLAAAGIPPDAVELAAVVHRAGVLLVMSAFSLALGERIRRHARERRAAELAATEAQADARARSDFVARMSHELRTPMTGVLGMAELLEMSPLEPQQRRYLATLRYSGDMLLSLINDMLDHARLEAGRLQLRHEAFDLYRLVDDVRTLFERQPRDAGVSLHVAMEAGVPRILVGDAQRIRQVLVNLLAHALRHTPAGRVVLEVAPAAGPGRVLFRVVDGGPPLDEEAAARLFRFGRTAPGGGHSGRAGGGPGLAIGHELCECMGGTLAAHNRGEGIAGVVFVMELPLHAGEL